jgi:hypothetical protein
MTGYRVWIYWCDCEDKGRSPLVMIKVGDGCGRDDLYWKGLLKHDLVFTSIKFRMSHNDRLTPFCRKP